MDKGVIAQYIIKKSKSQKDKREMHLIEDIEEAREELKNLRQYFDTVNDPRLVDYAIYMEEAAKAKYDYLLNKAKKNKLRTTNSSVVRKLNVG